MRKKKYYVYYQPNKKDLKDNYGDCTIRSLAKALDISWVEAFDKVVVCERKYQCLIPCMPLDITKKVYSELGFKYTGISNKKGSKRPTVESFTKEHKTGTYILRVSGHLVCVKDGKFYDTWDSGYKPLYGYFERIE